MRTPLSSATGASFAAAFPETAALYRTHGNATESLQLLSAAVTAGTPPAATPTSSCGAACGAGIVAAVLVVAISVGVAFVVLRRGRGSGAADDDFDHDQPPLTDTLLSLPSDHPTVVEADRWADEALGLSSSRVTAPTAADEDELLGGRPLGR